MKLTKTTLALQAVFQPRTAASHLTSLLNGGEFTKFTQPSIDMMLQLDLCLQGIFH